MQAIWFMGVLVIGQVQPIQANPTPLATPPLAIESKQGIPAQDDAAPALPPGQFWFDTQYMAGWIRGGRVPPLVTAGTGSSNPGVLGQEGTTVLFGDERLDGDHRSGVRASMGGWLNCEQTWGVEARVFWLPSTANGETFGGPGQPVVSRPFLNALSGQADAELVALPGVIAGTVSVNTESGPFIGADLALRKKLGCGCNYRIDGLFGYRFLYFRDRVEINEHLMSLDPAATPTNFGINDTFKATNMFHGADIGLTGSFWWKRISVDFLARAALGDVHQDVQIDGSTAVTIPGQPRIVAPGGLLALPSNIGHHQNDDFAVVPELGLGITYQPARNLRARAGYTCLVWPKVARAGDQIDPVVNTNLIPPTVFSAPARPAFMGTTETLWLHSLNLGLEFRF